MQPIHTANEIQIGISQLLNIWFLKYWSLNYGFPGRLIHFGGSDIVYFFAKGGITKVAVNFS